MSDKPRLSEQERREIAQSNAGQVVSETSSAVAPREMKQMVSARFEPELIAALREIARDRGVSMSDLLRQAALSLVDDARRFPYLHVEITESAFSRTASSHSTTVTGPGFWTINES
jgi:hypothetical protein